MASPTTAATSAWRQAWEWASASLSDIRSCVLSAEEAEPVRLRPSILPKNYLVEFIAGTFGPASSGRGLTTHLESEENVRRVVTRTNLGVMTAQDLEASSRRKLEEVNFTRAVKFKHVMEHIADHVLSSVNRPEDRPHVIREVLYLDDSPLAQHIAQRMADTHFVERLASESARIPDGPFAALRRASTAAAFADLEGRFRTEFASFVPDVAVDETGMRSPVGDDKTLKIINRVFDCFAPRMILIGHSQGGLVALHTMQLGMRRVRVKDSRRFLYSPRSGRVHRYSPVALSIGLAAPYDGIEQSPPAFDGGRGQSLDDESVPELVRMLMPGVPQMLRGSEFLKMVRGAFIPFDCAAISIGNPRDGIVPLESTRLPVGDFKNMHNLEVGSYSRFDVAEMTPSIFRAAFDLWPTTRFRQTLNENPRFEGLRQHCSMLFDLDANWDVDRGEIVRQIFAGVRGQGLFDEMMYEVNFDGLREQLMANLLYKLRTADLDDRHELEWLAPRLAAMIRDEAMPFLNSIDKRAALALNYIEPQ